MPTRFLTFLILCFAITSNLTAEAFNLLYHPIYGTPSGNSSPGNILGRINSILHTGATGTATPRRIQFALRMDF